MKYEITAIFKYSDTVFIGIFENDKITDFAEIIYDKNKAKEMLENELYIVMIESNNEKNFVYEMQKIQLVNPENMPLIIGKLDKAAAIDLIEEKVSIIKNMTIH